VNQGPPPDGPPTLPESLALGTALFETVAVDGGAVLRLDAHLDRLERAARSLGRALPPRAVLGADLARAARALPGGRGALRLTVAASAEGGESAPRHWLTPRELPTVPDAGLVLRCSARAVEGPGTLDAIKHASRLPKVLERERARAAGADDALLGRGDGEWLETTVANLWLLLDGRLRTPPIHRGCLPGVLRAALLADPAPPFPTEVARVHTADLLRAREVLCTNSLWGVVGVARLLDAPEGVRGTWPGASGPAARALRQRFADPRSELPAPGPSEGGAAAVPGPDRP
jgi:branched-subunit amino acid aminotransferase/4-amino-4-deoxychorismate lyase